VTTEDDRDKEFEDFYRNTVLSILCTTCGAEIGTRCISARGKPYDVFASHSSRKTASKVVAFSNARLLREMGIHLNSVPHKRSSTGEKSK
jgi:hypothetical protein